LSRVSPLGSFEHSSDDS